MSRPLKILSGLLIAALIAAGITGVAFWSANNIGQAPAPGLYVNGKLVEDPGTMLTIGGQDFSFDEYRHYFLLNRNLFENYYGADMWDSDPDGDRAWSLRKSVETELSNLVAWLKIAEEEGVSLTQEDMDEIQRVIDEQKAELGDGYDENLADLYFQNEATYRQVTEWQTLSEKIQSAVAEQLQAQVEIPTTATAEQEYDENYITAKHILIKVDPAAEDAEQAKADALSKAEQIVADILAEAEANSETPAGADSTPPDDDSALPDADSAAAGEDEGTAGEDTAAQPAALDPQALAEAFDRYMQLNSEDPGLETNPDGYTFTEGEMVEIFYDTAAALPVYEMSEPVWSESDSYSGYHIILRLPLDESQKQTFVDGKVTAEVNRLKQERVDGVIASFDIVAGPYYEALKPKDIQ